MNGKFFGVGVVMEKLRKACVPKKKCSRRSYLFMIISSHTPN